MGETIGVAHGQRDRMGKSMTAREILIARYRAAEVVDPEGYADVTLLELGLSGFVIVPRKATEAMVDAANALPVTSQANGLIAITITRYSGVTGFDGPPNTPLEQWWSAMVEEATRP